MLLHLRSPLSNGFVRCKTIRHSCSSTKIILKGSLSAPAYKPEVVERFKYKEWDESGNFYAHNQSDKKPFSMVLPPPNVTGNLHLGHALACTIQDVILRQKRSKGYNVLWLPGTDHAGIATQMEQAKDESTVNQKPVSDNLPKLESVVEKYLQSAQNKTRQEIGREAFCQEVWHWKEKHGNNICDQLRILGCSLDWSRQMFTMDPKHSHAVNVAFIKLFKKGLIYRRKSLVNWCNKLQSTVSDIEVENMPINGPTDVDVPGCSKPVKFGLLYEFAYKVVDSDEEVVVSTTMPETMIGDVAIAVHPEDIRYKHLRGKKVTHPFFKDKTIPIIFDNFVDMEFGTGVVKITPAHSKIDYNVGKVHNLPLLQIINEKGLIQQCERFNGLKKYDCRELIVKELNELGLLKNVREHNMILPVCSRTGDVIEYLPKEQWFLSCGKLNQSAVQLVENGQLKIIPEKFVRNWLDWTRDDRDWCISRQLWWGHQIPAYKCTANDNIVWIAAMDPETARNEASIHLRMIPNDITAVKDDDVLDTWFSSGIYPFAALGWPDSQNLDYKKFYPLNLMATGHDILGFWVHRMVILGLELTEKLPFSNVLLHGVICDSKGAKMSKSKGNVIDPIDVINGITLEDLKEKTVMMHKNGVLNKAELKKALSYHKTNYKSFKGIPECGVDALRFTLLSQDIKSHFVTFDLLQCHANKLFCNKIWQSLKYTHLCFEKLKDTSEIITQEDLTLFDKWILSRLSAMVQTVSASSNEYDFHLATKALRTFLYNEFCDVFVEATKIGFENKNVKIGYAHCHTLSAVLNTSLRCLNPFMIYVTHELIPKIPAFESNIIINFKDQNMYYDLPKYEDFKQWSNNEVESRANQVLNILNLVRQLKGLYNITNKLNPSIQIKSNDDKLLSDLNDYKHTILYLTRCSEMETVENVSKGITSKIDDKTIIGITIKGDNVNETILAARENLVKKISKLEEELRKLEERCSNKHYIITVSEDLQVLDHEKLLKKKEEIKHLQRLI